MQGRKQALERTEAASRRCSVLFVLFQMTKTNSKAWKVLFLASCVVRRFVDKISRIDVLFVFYSNMNSFQIFYLNFHPDIFLIAVRVITSAEFKKKLKHRCFPVKFSKSKENLFWRTSANGCSRYLRLIMKWKLTPNKFANIFDLRIPNNWSQTAKTYNLFVIVDLCFCCPTSWYLRYINKFELGFSIWLPFSICYLVFQAAVVWVLFFMFYFAHFCFAFSDNQLHEPENVQGFWAKFLALEWVL